MSWQQRMKRGFGRDESRLYGAFANLESRISISSPGSSNDWRRTPRSHILAAEAIMPAAQTGTERSSDEIFAEVYGRLKAMASRRLAGVHGAPFNAKAP
jgi:hypothetical protein